jgi:hypothetical protein
MHWLIVVLGSICLLKILLEVYKTLFGIFYPFIIGKPKDLKLLAGCLSHQLQYAVMQKLIPGFLADIMMNHQSEVLKKQLSGTAETSKKDS